MTKTLAIYQNVSIKELRVMLFSCRKELALLRLQNSVKSLKKTHQISVVKTKIAHISTVLSSLYTK